MGFSVAAASAIIFGALIVLSISVYDTLTTSYTGLRRAEDERNSMVFQRLNTHIKIREVIAHSQTSLEIKAENTGDTVIKISDNGMLLIDVIINGTLATGHIKDYLVRNRTTTLWGPGEILSLKLYDVKTGDNTSIILITPEGAMAAYILHVYAPPTAIFIIQGESVPYVIEEDQRYIFDGTSSLSGTEITEYFWDFDDGSFSYGERTEHIFSQPGIYRPVLRIRDKLGRTDTFSVDVEVKDITPPFASILAPAEADEDVQVNFSSNVWDNVGISTYHWELGNGESASTQDTSHIFEKPGFYSITLTVKDTSNLTYTTSTNIHIRDITPPVADAGEDKVTRVNETVYFNASTSYDPENGSIVSYVWDFGDGIHDSGIYTKHIYTHPGNYTAILTIKDLAGNSSQDLVNVEVTD